MLNPYLTNEAKLLFAKTFHDMAAPLGALTLCIDDIKKALPESGDLIETSIETLFQRIAYWRLMLTGGDQSPSYSDAAIVMRSMAKLKSVELIFLPAEDYQGNYIRLILGLVLLGIESLPRGGKIAIDADAGILTVSGEKCFILKELQEIFDQKVEVPTSRHALGMLICEWAKACKASISFEHTPTSLIFRLQ